MNSSLKHIKELDGFSWSFILLEDLVEAVEHFVIRNIFNASPLEKYNIHIENAFHVHPTYHVAARKSVKALEIISIVQNCPYILKEMLVLENLCRLISDSIQGTFLGSRYCNTAVGKLQNARREKLLVV